MNTKSLALWINREFGNSLSVMAYQVEFYLTVVLWQVIQENCISVLH